MTSNMKLMALLLNDVGPAGCQVRERAHVFGNAYQRKHTWIRAEVPVKMPNIKGSINPQALHWAGCQGFRGGGCIWGKV